MLSLAYAVVTARGLYDDGSYYFLRVLQANGFTEMVFSRGHVGYLYELPVVVALKLGITNLEVLKMAFGIGCFCWWPVAMWLCYRLAREHFWLVVLAAGAAYLNAAFVAVGEHVVAHAFFWPVAFVLLFVRPLTKFAAVVLLGSSIILLRSYESMIFFGPVLAWLAFQRGRTESTSSGRIIFLMSAMILLLSVPISVDGVVHPSHASSSKNFTSGIFLLLASPGWTVSWTAFWLLLMVGGSWSRVRQWVVSPAGVLLLAVAVLLWGAWPLLAPAQLDPFKQHEARFLDLLAPLALLAVGGCLVRFPGWFQARRNYLINMSAVLLLAQSLWHLAATEQWRGFTVVLHNMMSTQKGIVRLLDTPYGTQPAVGRQATRFIWVMDFLNLCVEIGPRHVQALVLGDPFIDNEVVNRQMLNCYELDSLPNLKRYGVDYSEYEKSFKPSDLNFSPPPASVHVPPDLLEIGAWTGF